MQEVILSHKWEYVSLPGEELSNTRHTPYPRRTFHDINKQRILFLSHDVLTPHKLA